MTRKIAAGVLAVVSLTSLAAPAYGKPARPSISVLDEVTEGTWARYPIDLTWGQSAHAIYSGSDYARVSCNNEAGQPAWTGPIQYLQGEGGPGVSVDIPVLIPYVPATYTFCTIDLLGGPKRNRVIASDNFVVYSPV
jgi:hypothetical protein